MIKIPQISPNCKRRVGWKNLPGERMGQVRVFFAKSLVFVESNPFEHPDSCGETPLLVGGLEHDFYDFPSIGNVIIPTDELHHFSEG